MNLTELLIYIEKRPLMYLKSKKLEELEAFMGGYDMALHLNKIQSETDKAFKDQFYYYIFSKYDIEKTHTWYDAVKIIAKNEGVDEFDKFFELLNKFKQEKPENNQNPFIAKN